MLTLVGGAVLVATLLAGFVGFGLALIGWRKRETPGSWLFAPLMATLGIWSWANFLALWLPPSLGRWAFVVDSSMEPAIAVLFLGFVLEYTGRDEWLTPRWMAVLAGWAVLNPVVFWAPSWLSRYLHGPLGYARVSGLVVHYFAVRVGFVLFASLSYALVVVGFLLLGQFILRNSDHYRTQPTLIFVAGLFPAVANLVYQFQRSAIHPRLDLTPVFFAVAGIGIGWALYRHDFLQVTPVSTDRMIEEMTDVVLVLDDRDRLIEFNPAARSLFATDPDRVIGEPIDDVLPGLLDAVHSGTSFAPEGTPATIYEPETTPFYDTFDRQRGRLVVLRDVTALREREQQLEQLRQVLSRVLRHDIRNDLNVIRGQAEVIANAEDERLRTLAETIVETSDSLTDTSRKARRIERAILQQDDSLEVDVTAATERAIGRVEADYPDATIETDLPDAATVDAHVDLEAAIENLVENAVEHNDDEPWVRVTAANGDGVVALRIADDGPGIPEQDLVALEQREETALEHSSGAGLWLAAAVVTASEGDLSFDTSTDGTTVEVRLRAA